MNKAKINTIIEEALTSIEHNDVLEKVEKEYTERLLYRLKIFFSDAYYGYSIRNAVPKTDTEKREKGAYMQVKDLIAESVQKYMSKL